MINTKRLPMPIVIKVLKSLQDKTQLQLGKDKDDIEVLAHSLYIGCGEQLSEREFTNWFVENRKTIKGLYGHGISIWEAYLRLVKYIGV